MYVNVELLKLSAQLKNFNKTKRIEGQHNNLALTIFN